MPRDTALYFIYCEWKRKLYRNNGQSCCQKIISTNEYIPDVQPHINKRPQTYDIPSILTTNVRAIGNKIDEIQLVAELNSVGAICVTKTWLSSTVPDLHITIPGFNLFRKDWTHTSGGGVCIY